MTCRAQAKPPKPRFTPHPVVGPHFTMLEPVSTLHLGELKVGVICGRCCVAGEFNYDLITRDRDLLLNIPEWALEEAGDHRTRRAV